MIIKESPAVVDAKKRGLEYAGFGYWKDRSGKTIAKTVDDKLILLKPGEQSAPKKPIQKRDMYTGKRRFSPEELPIRYTKEQISPKELLRLITVAKKLATKLRGLGRNNPAPEYFPGFRSSLGLYKTAFVGPEWVIKFGRQWMIAQESYNIDALAAHSELHKYIPETHIFNYKSYGVVIQKKYKVIEDADLMNYHTQDKFDQLVLTLTEYGFGDIHAGNVGWDEDGNPVVIDLGENIQDYGNDDENQPSPKYPDGDEYF